MSSIKDTYNILFAGGGTGGHIYPALAIAQELRSSMSNVNIIFAGSLARMEADIVPKYHYEYYPVDVRQIRRTLSFGTLKAILKLIASIRYGKFLLRHKKIDLVIGTGGYISFPFVYAAKNVCNIILHEQNILPGAVTKITKKYAQKVLTSFGETGAYLKNARNVRYTGNPVFRRQPTEAIEQIETKEAGAVTMLCFGGSAGAHVINTWLLDHYASLNDAGVEILWQTGKREYERIKDAVKDNSMTKVYNYIQNMDAVYEKSDLVLSRAGATSIAEILYYEKPSILIPYRYAANNHQEKNADVLVEYGCAIKVREEEMQDRLYDAVLSLVDNPGSREQFEQAARAHTNKNTAKDIVKYIQDVLTDTGEAYV